MFGKLTLLKVCFQAGGEQYRQDHRQDGAQTEPAGGLGEWCLGGGAEGCIEFITGWIDEVMVMLSFFPHVCTLGWMSGRAY